MSPPTQGGRWPPGSLGVTMTYADDLDTQRGEDEFDDDEDDEDDEDDDLDDEDFGDEDEQEPQH